MPNGPRQFSGKYEEICQIGQGGMGEVFKVRHTGLDRIRALKTLRGDLARDAEFVTRFYREARVMAQLDHSNVVRVFELEKDEVHGHYFVMEYIQGKTLLQFAKDKGTLSDLDVVKIATSVAQALNYAHKLTPPAIHRDIKPTNIMVENGTERVVVMDFGIAKELDGSDLTGFFMGTPKYSPPEQIMCIPLDGRADIYALGMVMYEILTGKHLLADLNRTEQMTAVLAPEEFKPAFPETTSPLLANIIRKAIAKNHDRRYRNMEEMLRDLEACRVSLNKPQQKLAAQAETYAQTARNEAEAEGVGADQPAYGLALEAQQQGKAAFEAGEYGQAVEAFRQTAALFAQARAQTVRARDTEAAEVSRQRADELRAEAEAAGAPQHLTARYEKVLKKTGEAKRLKDGGEFIKAREAYEVVAQGWKLLIDEAILRDQQEKAEMARSQLYEQKRTKDPLRGWAQALWAAADQAAMKTDEAWRNKNYPLAVQLCGDSMQAYAAAVSLAETERRLNQKAIAAQQKAVKAHKAAESAGGQQRHATHLYQEATGALCKGEEALKSQRWTEAEEHFTIAAERLGACAQEANRSKEKQMAEAARQDARVAGQEAQRENAMELLPENYALTAEGLRQAEQTFAEGDYRGACERFEACASQFRQLGLEALSKSAGQTRARGQELRRAVTATAHTGRVVKLAHKTFDSGERLFQKGNFQEARAKYQEAATRYSELLNTPVSPKPPILTRPLIRYSALAIGSITAAAGIFYLFRPAYPPPQVSPPPEPAEPVKIEPSLLNAFKRKANLENIPYQTLIKKLMRDWLKHPRSL
jgi:serine/threonine-protein kinase